MYGHGEKFSHSKRYFSFDAWQAPVGCIFGGDICELLLRESWKDFMFAEK